MPFYEGTVFMDAVFIVSGLASSSSAVKITGWCRNLADSQYLPKRYLFTPCQIFIDFL